jgi:hypothetical protein
MDSVTVGDLSIFQIEIGYGHIYIYPYFAPLFLSQLVNLCSG